MVQAIKQTATIQPGGRIELLATDLPVGTTVEVIVLVSRSAAAKRYRDLIGSGRGSFASPEDVDIFLRKERDAWHN